MRTTLVLSAALLLGGCISAAERRDYRELACEYECEYWRECNLYGYEPAVDDCYDYCGTVPIGTPRACIEAEQALLECALTLACDEEYGVDKGCASESQSVEKHCGYSVGEPTPHHEVELREDWPLQASSWGDLFYGEGPRLFEEGEGMLYMPLSNGEVDLWLLFRSNETGAIALASGDNFALSTCRQCIIARDYRDGVATHYFQGEGELEISADAVPMSGNGMHLSLSGVKLVEYDLWADKPIAWGGTVTIDDATLARDAIPEGWTCSPDDWQDWWYPSHGGDPHRVCDCGCGVPDIDCPPDASVEVCDSCGGCVPLDVSCSEGLDPADVSQCL